MPNQYLASGSISAYVNTIYEDALLVLRDNNLMTNLVATFGDRSGTAARVLPQYGTATMSSLTETTDLDGSYQAFAPSNLSTLTPAEAGGGFLLTDLRVETDPFQIQRDAAMELGLAMSQKIESDIISDFGSVTGGTVGSAGGTLTWGNFFAALTRLRAGNAPFPYNCVLHPTHWHYLAKTASVAGASLAQAPEFSNTIMANWFVAKVGPVNIFVTSNITVGTAAIGVMFSPIALAYDSRRAPRLEYQRNASMRAWELNMTTVYGHGAWRKALGVQMIGDATLPSS